MDWEINCAWNTVFEDGKLLIEDSLSTVRKRITNNF